MKKTILITFSATLGFSANAQDVNIPDAKFKAALLSDTINFINTNKDNEIQLSEATAFKGTINVYNKDISDLTGIEAFANLTKLSCSYNSLKTLNISNNIFLKELQCSYNSLNSLNVSKNTFLNDLDCENNSLSSLDVSKNTEIKFLICNSNFIKSLDLSKNISLFRLDCYSNSLNFLNIATVIIKILKICYQEIILIFLAYK